MSTFYHEQLYRSKELMQKLSDLAIAVCGAGALGANIIENLARSGCKTLKVIDRDRIMERNLSTQPYFRSDIGSLKAHILSNNLYRALGTTVDAHPKELTQNNVAKFLKKSSLVIDTFDNSVSRKIVKEYCQEKKISCLHVGLASNYAEVIWNEAYRVPSDVNDDICDYPLARNLAILATAVACEEVISFIATQKQRNFTITLKDIVVKNFGT